MLRIALLILSITQALAPYLSTILGFGRQVGDGSQASFPIVPAGYTFGIRFPIFLGCIIFAIYALTRQGRHTVSPAIIARTSIVFLLITARSIVVSYTDLFWLPVLLFIIAAVVLLQLSIKRSRIQALLTGTKYRLIFVPLMLFVGRANAAFRLNIGTAMMDYDRHLFGRSRDLIALLILLLVAIRQYRSIRLFRLPNAVVLTYLWAIIGVVVGLGSHIAPTYLLMAGTLHAVGLSYLVARRLTCIK